MNDDKWEILFGIVIVAVCLKWAIMAQILVVIVAVGVTLINSTVESKFNYYEGCDCYGRFVKCKKCDTKITVSDEEERINVPCTCCGTILKERIEHAPRC